MEIIGKIFFLFSIFTVIGELSASIPTVLILSQNIWFIFRAPNRYCMLTDGQNKDNNGKLVMWDECSVSVSNAWWHAGAIPSNTYQFTLKNQQSDLCLTVGTDLQDNGYDSPVIQYACQSKPPATQLWESEIITVAHEHWIRLKGSGGRCLSYNPALRGAMYMYDCGCCDRYPNQYFKLDYSENEFLLNKEPKIISTSNNLTKISSKHSVSNT